MPLPLAALIGLGTGLLGAASQGNQNRKNRAFAREQYSTARRDALTDRDFENNYNSPAAQMQRLKEAKLNPNLVYDGGGATVNSATARSAPQNTPNTDTPQIDPRPINAGLMQQYEINQLQAQTDNVKQMTEVAKMDEILKATQNLNITSDTALKDVNTMQGKFNLNIANDLLSNTIEKAQLDVKNAQADLTTKAANTKYTLDNNERQKLANANSIAQGVEAILRSKADRAKTVDERSYIQQQIKNLGQDSELKQIDIDLRKKGINPNDSIMERTGGRLLNWIETKISTIMDPKNWNSASLPKQ